MTPSPTALAINERNADSLIYTNTAESVQPIANHRTAQQFAAWVETHQPNTGTVIPVSGGYVIRIGTPLSTGSDSAGWIDRGWEFTHFGNLESIRAHLGY